MAYGAQKLTLTRKGINRVAQRAMERSTLGVYLKDKIPNAKIRRGTGVTGAIRKIAPFKWNWAGHIAITSDGLWKTRIFSKSRTATYKMGR